MLPFSTTLISQIEKKHVLPKRRYPSIILRDTLHDTVRTVDRITTWRQTRNITTKAFAKNFILDQIRINITYT